MDAEKPRPSISNVQSSCTVGRKLQEECHRTYYTRKSGLKQVASLEKKTQELLSWRANITFSLEDTVCLHHEALYLIRYESRQTSCCDPFKMHKKSVRSKSQSLSCPWFYYALCRGWGIYIYLGPIIRSRWSLDRITPSEYLKGRTVLWSKDMYSSVLEIKIKE